MGVWGWAAASQATDGTELVALAAKQHSEMLAQKSHLEVEARLSLEPPGEAPHSRLVSLHRCLSTLQVSGL